MVIKVQMVVQFNVVIVQVNPKTVLLVLETQQERTLLPVDVQMDILKLGELYVQLANILVKLVQIQLIIVPPA